MGEDTESADASKFVIKNLLDQLKRMGVSTKLFHDTIFEAESDWAFIIRLHTIIEATLNHLIVGHFKNEHLYEVISELDVSDQRRGKLAFIKALELLPKHYRSFIKQFSEIRNALVHDIKNLDFNLKSYLDGEGKGRRKNIAEALQEMFPAVNITKAIVDNPRMCILMGATGVIVLAGEKSTFLLEPSESIPKEQ